MIVDFTIYPTDAGESVSAYVAEVFRIIEASGLSCEHHAMGTNIEGDWDEVMAVIKACRERMLERANRISISIRIDERKGVTNGIKTKVASARAKMRRSDG
ncbi:MAG TPA: MTH1187 family thiamine-binding protein [Candidatus Acetothermia bacterium]|nr:MTH1187 family thiamine-binding protein [Candidatus Acetothermia bacterium]